MKKTDKEMLNLRNKIKEVRLIAGKMCEECRGDCIEKECRGWWVRVYLKKASDNVPTNKPSQ